MTDPRLVRTSHGMFVLLTYILSEMFATLDVMLYTKKGLSCVDKNDRAVE